MDCFNDFCSTHLPSYNNAELFYLSDPEEDEESSSFLKALSDNVNVDLDQLSTLEIQPIQNQKMEVLLAENIKQDFDFTSWAGTSSLESWQESDSINIIADELLSQWDALPPGVISDALSLGDASATLEELLNGQKSQEIFENLYQALGSNSKTMSNLKKIDHLEEGLDDILSLFESGIEASDIGTLLEKFEEVSATSGCPSDNEKKADEPKASTTKSSKPKVSYQIEKDENSPLKITLKLKKDSKEAWLLKSTGKLSAIEANKPEKNLRRIKSGRIRSSCHSYGKVINSKVIEKMRLASIRKSAILIPVEATKSLARKLVNDTFKINKCSPSKVEHFKLDPETAQRKAFGSLLDHDYHKDWITPTFTDVPVSIKVITSSPSKNNNKTCVNTSSLEIDVQPKSPSIDSSSIVRIQTVSNIKDEEDEIIDVVGIEEDEVKDLSSEEMLMALLNNTPLQGDNLSPNVVSSPEPPIIFSEKTKMEIGNISLNCLNNESTVETPSSNDAHVELKLPKVELNENVKLKLPKVELNENVKHNKETDNFKLSDNLEIIPRKKVLPIQYRTIKNHSESDMEDGEVLDTSIESNNSDSENYFNKIPDYTNYENPKYNQRSSSISQTSIHSCSSLSGHFKSLSKLRSLSSRRHHRRRSRRTHHCKRRVYSHRNRSRSYSEESSQSSSRDSESLTSRSSSRHRQDDKKRSRYSHSRSSSSSPDRSLSRSPSRRHYQKRHRSHCSTERKVCHQQNLEQKKQIEERRVVYVGNITSETTKKDLQKRFNKFGPIEDISVHFRDYGDNYGFVTFVNRNDAYQAVEHGNDDHNERQYDLCFGGRRLFCKNSYADLDSRNDLKNGIGYWSRNTTNDFDTLLQQALGKLKDKDSL